MKQFKDATCERNQMMLIPLSLDECIPQDHEVRLLDEIIESLDLTTFALAYGQRGAPAYDPKMMLRVVLYGVWRGIRSSRDLARQLQESLVFRWLSRMQYPSYPTIARFMKRHRKDLGALFAQTVELAREVKLAPLAHVAVDGTAIEADVSAKNVWSKERLQKTQQFVDQQISLWLKRDREEDAELGQKRGDELPAELATLEARKARIQELQDQREQINRRSIAATDPKSRMMRVRGAMRPAYNAQAAVDEANQIIVAADVILQETDNDALPGMVEQITANAGEAPKTVLADAGYAGPALFKYAGEHPQIDFYVAQQRRKTDWRESFTHDAERDVMIRTDGREYLYKRMRKKHGTNYKVYEAASADSEVWEPESAQFNRDMREKLSSAEGKAIYNLRRQTVEPVFGFMKMRMRMRRFLRRGHAAVRAEFMMACIAHNLGKIARYGFVHP